ncbi:Nramp family divalent metal transporter [Variovorax arabinosiphilus]|uniref:Nramp family divalent metal transporter n=1 Tax=Variovorax arabinosiphilus TaxID=3053498 RepID=UPI002574A94D|nr:MULTISPECIES: Nramp family divalent metal transporter [unclassified Variovorax]MDM0120328.1 Nramp family divalent metal transporter [Variovorax sp. J2L1-78]MDM0127760.1 Nramp family divalent metal transporter [Variovorax sp. J2L1-63]MDM0231459.1 Nramp family divalent metal transporter [Variovorax sp. J2R1-6]
MKKRIPSFLRHVGPGVVTGAADDDPSGIATYTQAGAQFGTGLLWTVFLSLPFMIAIQMVSARIGRVTGQGVAANLRDHMPRWLLLGLVGLLVIANTINIAADIGAMGEALQLVVGGGQHFHSLAFGAVTVLLQVFVPYRRLAHILKWLTLTLFAYVAAVFVVDVPWGRVLHDLVVPKLQWRSDYWMMIVALLGTTISPYLFFWQASQEVEELRQKGGRRGSDAEVWRALRRVKLDTWIGMIFSNAIAFFVMVVGGAVLFKAGIHDVTSAAQAAEALRPLAGDFAFWLFAGGIIATGLLAVPVLASSAAYAVAEAFGWEEGLERHWHEAKRFYAIIGIATLAGTALDFTPVDPMKALYWSAVINGVVAVPIMAAMMMLVAREKVMGAFVASRRTRWLGWVGTALMGFAVLMMLRDVVA